VQVSGLVERPADVGTATRRVFLSVNGRAVRDAGIVRAVEAAYRSTIPAGVRPSLFLGVIVPADEVDVNVHPAKAEVRFRDRWQIERAAERAVRRALGTLESAADVGGRWYGGREPQVATGWGGGVADGEASLGALRVAPSSLGSLFVPDASAPPAEPAPIATASAPREDDDDPIVVPPLVQLRRTYLMFEREDGVVLIDQHSAHERVLYEQFMGALERGETSSQRLLFPLTLHLGPAQGDAFDEHRELFARLGFEVDAFGGHTLLVHSVPMPHPRFDAERCLRETLDALTGDRRAAVHARHERLAATVACKAAIKAGDALGPGEMRALFVALARTTLPAHNVHGRSTIVQLAWDELERRFGRR
jgi:DNA mismatch repair protein MutL